MECSHENFFSDKSPDIKCYIADKKCGDYWDLINFMALTFCYYDGAWQFFLFQAIFMVFYIFRFIQVTVETYMAPAIQFIAQYFSIPDSLCAITLLALINGAGDLVAAFVASTTEGGLYYNLGAIYGAGLFVCSVVVGLVILLQKDTIQINPVSLSRDIGVYIFSTFMMIGFGIYGEINVITSVLMLSIYFCLVLYIGIDEFLKKRRGEKTEDLILRQALVNIQLTSFDEFNAMEIPSSYDKIYAQQNSIGSQRNQLEEDFRLEDYTPTRNTCRFFMRLIDLPIQSSLFISVPNSPEQNYSRWRLTFFALPASILMTLIHVGHFDIIFYAKYILGPVILFCIIVYFTTKNAFQPSYFIVFQFLSIYICLGWTYFSTDILIDILQAIGLISNLEKSYLGLTIISIGNALPDAVTTIALAKQGQANLGIIGSYTGQLFGLLVGLGVALLKSTLKNGPIEFKIFTEEGYMIENIVIFTTLGILIGTFIAVKFFKGVLTKLLGFILVTVYFGFFIAVTLIAFSKSV